MEQLVEALLNFLILITLRGDSIVYIEIITPNNVWGICCWTLSGTVGS